MNSLLLLEPTKLYKAVQHPLAEIHALDGGSGSDNMNELSTIGECVVLAKNDRIISELSISHIF